MDQAYYRFACPARGELRGFRGASIPRFTHYASRITFHLSRIKRVAQQQVEVVDSQGELGIRISRFFIQIALLQALSGAAEAGAEGELLIRILQLAEQAADFLGPLARGADDAQGRAELRVTGPDALEEDAFKLAAVLGAVWIDATPAVIERGARLCQAQRSHYRARGANGQAKRPQPRGIVSRPQPDISKDDAIAAEPADGAELADDCVVRILRAVQTGRKLRPNFSEGNVFVFWGCLPERSLARS